MGANPIIFQAVINTKNELTIIRLLLMGIEVTDLAGKVTIKHKATGLTHAVAWQNLNAGILDIRLANVYLVVKGHMGRTL